MGAAEVFMYCSKKSFYGRRACVGDDVLYVSRRRAKDLRRTLDDCDGLWPAKIISVNRDDGVDLLVFCSNGVMVCGNILYAHGGMADRGNTWLWPPAVDHACATAAPTLAAIAAAMQSLTEAREAYLSEQATPSESQSA